MADKDLQARDKVAHQAPGESTRNVTIYIPLVDIYESEEALTVVADMPGVSPENVSIDVHDNQLTIRGTGTAEDENERMLLQEYRVGDYFRQFTLGRTIDQAKIEASMKDGSLTLVLPKADTAKARKITVKAME